MFDGLPRNISIASGALEVWGYTSVDSGTFELSVLEPGNLVVTFGAANLAAVFGTRAVFIDAGCLMPSCPIWAKTFPPEPGDRSVERARERKIESVLEVARSMRRHGRGGTLLLVPEGEAWRASLQEPLSYEPTSEFPRARATVGRVLRRLERLLDELDVLRVDGGPSPAAGRRARLT